MIADMEVEGLSKAEKVITENYENGSDCGERNKICIGFYLLMMKRWNWKR